LNSLVVIEAYFKIAGDHTKGDAFVEEGVDQHLIRYREIGGQGSSLAGGVVGKRETAEALQVGREEGQLRDFKQVQFPPAALDACGIREGVLNGCTHI